MRSRLIAPVAPMVVAALLALAGCDEDGGAASSTTTTATASTDATVDRPPSLRPPPCPTTAGNCERASGQIAFVERVDPDGDGDAHFVLVSDESITAPGISVIDVRPDLRPEPLPRPGDMLAASGPVYEGSFGQRQIQADAIRFVRGR